MKTRFALQRSFYVLPTALALGWAIATTPVTQAASSVTLTDIIDGSFDVNRDTRIDSADDLASILLFFSDAAPIRGDIIDGRLDLDYDGVLNQHDTAANLDLTYSPYRQNLEVDVINGFVDVDGGGISTSDDFPHIHLVQVLPLPPMINLEIIGGKVYPDTTDILLSFNDAALIRVDIWNGSVDVGQDQIISNYDFLKDVDLDEPQAGGQVSNSVDIRTGQVDVNQDGVINSLDDATVRVVKLDPLSFVRHINILQGLVDVDQNGAINNMDNLPGVLLLFGDAAAARVDIRRGKVDVDGDGLANNSDDLPDADLNVISAYGFRRNDQVDIHSGRVDVNEDGLITAADHATDVILLVP